MKNAICAVILAAVASIAFAQSSVKDGRPCLDGVCVGDELASLSGKKLDTAMSAIRNVPAKSARISAADIKRQAANFSPSSAPAVADATPYLLFGEFDGDAIPKLAKLKGFCAPLGTDLVGRYKGSDGAITNIYVNAEPGSDPSSQSLRVQSIVRTFPADLDKGKIADLTAEFKKQYAKVKQSSFDAKAPTWKFSPAERRLALAAPLGNRVAKQKQLAQYPGCKG